jgi:hypothetical protein
VVKLTYSKEYLRTLEDVMQLMEKRKCPPAWGLTIFEITREVNGKTGIVRNACRALEREGKVHSIVNGKSYRQYGL